MASTINSSSFLINGSAGGLSPIDRGFTYGDGIFRTMPVCLQANQPAPKLWELHYQKLVEDCDRLAITCPSANLLLGDISELFSYGEEGVAKIIITRGEGDRGYAIPVSSHPTRVVIKTPPPNYPASNLNKGVCLHLCRLRLRTQPYLAGIKHLNRLENIMARREWSDSHIADGLLMDEHSRVIECTMSNLFARFDKTLLTPNLSRCGVAGVTRSRILESAALAGLKAEIADLPLENLMQADEIIICNSLYGAWQVIELNGRKWQSLALAGQLRQILQD